MTTPDPELQDFSLPRTGQQNLAFTGELLHELKSPAFRRHTRNEKAKCHWFEAAIYKTQGGKFVLSLAYRWSGKLFREVANDDVWVFSTMDELFAKLETIEPVDYVNGYPPGPYWDEKQKQLMIDIDEDYTLLVQSLVAAVMAQAPVERID